MQTLPFLDRHYAITKNEKHRNMFNVLIHETYKDALHAEIACVCQGAQKRPMGPVPNGPNGAKGSQKGVKRSPKDPKSVPKR